MRSLFTPMSAAASVECAASLHREDAERVSLARGAMLATPLYRKLLRFVQKVAAFVARCFSEGKKVTKGFEKLLSLATKQQQICDHHKHRQKKT